MQYLTVWTDNINKGNSTDGRPKASGMLYDNTTVQGSWLDSGNMADLSKNNGGRVVNNVTMAMPHAGVFAAVRDERNSIMQPQDLNVSHSFPIFCVCAPPYAES